MLLVFLKAPFANVVFWLLLGITATGYVRF